MAARGQKSISNKSTARGFFCPVRRLFTVFENHRKSLIQHCERSELRLHFEWPKFIKNAKNSQF